MKPRYFANVGDRLGRGVVIEPEVRVPDGNGYRRYARMRCDCGGIYLARLSDFAPDPRHPPKRSCGCLALERAKEMGRANVKHGLHLHPLYDIWTGLMKRCYSPANPKYNRYGGRGIAVHETWHDLRVFVADIERILGPRPVGKSLDRYPDNDGDYAPGNVRWATPLEQSANREYQIALEFLTWAKTEHPDIVTEFGTRISRRF